jgi:hypothetical protein
MKGRREGEEKRGKEMGKTGENETRVGWIREWEVEEIDKVLRPSDEGRENGVEQQ